jgi:predicted lactoylglutathione lyase
LKVRVMSDSAPRLTVVTLGVRDFATSLRFYESLGFVRKMRKTGDETAFFDAGGVILALYRWKDLAADARLAAEPVPATFRGITLAWNKASAQEVDQGLARALKAGATLLKPAQKTDYGGYGGYFADPDGHAWEIVDAGFSFTEDGRLVLPD